MSWLLIPAAIFFVRLAIAAVEVWREERRPRVTRRDEFCTDDPTAVGIWHTGD
jgi:hypothetical protein